MQCEKECDNFSGDFQLQNSRILMPTWYFSPIKIYILFFYYYHLVFFLNAKERLTYIKLLKVFDTSR